MVFLHSCCTCYVVTRGTALPAGARVLGRRRQHRPPPSTSSSIIIITVTLDRTRPGSQLIDYIKVVFQMYTMQYNIQYNILMIYWLYTDYNPSRGARAGQWAINFKEGRDSRGACTKHSLLRQPHLERRPTTFGATAAALRFKQEGCVTVYYTDPYITCS